VAAPGAATAAAAAAAAEAEARRGAVDPARRHTAVVDSVMRLVLRVARHFTLVLLFVLAAVAGAVSGALVIFSSDLPQISALDDYSPSTITRVYASGGEVLAEFATQRRIVITYDQISPLLRQAIMAAEDSEFNTHLGLSITRIVVTLVKDIVEGKRAGASTLTQQLTRKLFLNDEKTWERKIKEALLAIQIEKRYTKNEIITLYCNQIPWGHGTYGAEAASRLYFNKSAKALTLDEAALLAGIIQAPARHSPYVNPQNALRRRNYALDRMAEEGFITRADAAAARLRPVVTAGRPDLDAEAPFFVENVRQHLEEAFGARQLYESGLAVYTTLDVPLQRAAEQAIDAGLRRLDKRRGFRRPPNVVAQGYAVEAYRHEAWRQAPRPGAIVPAVVTAVQGPRATVRVASLTGELDPRSYQWTGRTSAAFLKVGDLIELRVTEVNAGSGQIAGTLDQAPEAEGALVAIQNRTGKVLAMVGGLSFERSRFNRATQAMRQLGSTFKPIVFAAAIDRGYTPASILQDSPVSYAAGPGQPEYAPLNYDKLFEGPITLRRALEQSRNVPTVRLMEQVGPSQVIGYAERLGFSSKVQPFLSSALGSSEATLLEVTSAFAVFPNQGVRMSPYEVQRIVDRQGNALEENRPSSTESLRADTAYVMTNLLQGVALRGTAARAASLEWPIGGKTGTTDDFTDAWFIGFDPDITIGVWVGHDKKRTLGPGESGAAAALPIWMDVMKAWMGDRKERPEFTPPGNIVFLAVDRATGARVDPDAPGALREAFISGTQPGGEFGDK
jgi:penicillin-binding protein 1A